MKKKRLPRVLHRRPILSTRAFGATVYVIFLLTALFDYIGSLQVRVDDAIRQSTNVFVWGTNLITGTTARFRAVFPRKK